jgi:glucose-1-phosphate thymidylyltransferase
MIVNSVILAGGYSRRLSPTTDNIPKSLLIVVGRQILSYTFDKLNDLYGMCEGICYLTHNSKYTNDFRNFLTHEQPKFHVELIAEKSTGDIDKLDTIGAIGNVFHNELGGKASAGLVVIAGDSVSSLDLTKFLQCYDDGMKLQSPRSMVGLFDIHDLDAAKRYACAQVDKQPVGCITRFEEKPMSPFSTLVNTTYFVLTEPDLKRIKKFEQDIGRNGSKGFIDWLLTCNIPVNGYVFDGYWFDIGTHESLAEANSFMRAQLDNPSGSNPIPSAPAGIASKSRDL